MTRWPGNDDRNGITRIGQADGSDRSGITDPPGELRVADRFSIGNIAECLPDAELKSRAVKVERQSEPVGAVPRSIPSTVRVYRRAGHSHRPARRVRTSAAGETRRRPGPSRRRAVSGGRMGRAFQSGRAEFACVESERDCQRYTAAYARQGRQPRERATRAWGRFRPAALRKPKSAAGKASG